MLLSSFVGCNISSTPKVAILTIKSPQKKELNFSLTKLKFNLDVESITLKEGKLNSDGSIRLSIPLVHPAFIKSTVGKNDYYIYLEPGFNLIYKLPQNLKEKYGLFSGVGADENSYLQKSDTFWQECYNQIGNYMFSGTVNYSKFLDSTSTALSKFNSIQLKNKDFADHTLEIFNTRNEAKLVLMKSQFKFVHPLLFEQLDSVPKSFKNMFLKLPFNKKYLNYGMDNYFYSLDFYNRFEIIAPLNPKYAIEFLLGL